MAGPLLCKARGMWLALFPFETPNFAPACVRWPSCQHMRCAHKPREVVHTGHAEMRTPVGCSRMRVRAGRHGFPSTPVGSGRNLPAPALNRDSSTGSLVNPSGCGR